MLLAIDTSTRMMGLALYDGSSVLGEMAWQSQGHHTVELAPTVEELLHRTGVAWDDLEAVGVALGPGSFTGLRIGLALAKGLALSRFLPLVGVPTLDVVAAGHPVVDLPLAAVLRAGRGRLAVGWYRETAGRWESWRKPERLNAESLAKRIRQPTIVTGELAAEERRRLRRKRKNVLLASPASAQRRPAVLAELAWERMAAGELDDPLTLAPIYLHPKGEIFG